MEGVGGAGRRCKGGEEVVQDTKGCVCGEEKQVKKEKLYEWIGEEVKCKWWELVGGEPGENEEEEELGGSLESVRKF